MARRILFVSVLLMALTLSMAVYSAGDITVGNGLRISTEDGLHKFHLGGYLLFDVVVIDETETGIERFDLFNAWLHIVGTSYANIDYKIQFSVEDSSGTKLRDAYFSYRFAPQFRLRLGQYDMPTIAEHVSSLTYTTFAGRSIADSLTPGRDVGLLAEGALLDDRWHYSLGIFNGNGIDANSEENKHKDIAGRITGLMFQLDDANDLRMYSDLSFTTGKQSTDNIRFRSETGEIMLAANGLSINDRTRVAAGLYLYRGSAALNIIYLNNRYVLNALNMTGETSAWSLMMSYYLTGEHDTYQQGLFQKTKPHENYLNGRGGAWQLAARYSSWQADKSLVQAASAVTGATNNADKAEAISLGVNWIMTPNARINISWIKTKFERLPMSTLTRDSQSNLMVRFTAQFF